MISIQEQIQQNKQTKKDHLQELYFVDYCNNCRTGLASKYDVPCHHPWYCWHEGKSSEIQIEIVKLENKKQLSNYEYNKLKDLRVMQRKEFIKGLRKYRKDSKGRVVIYANRNKSR